MWFAVAAALALIASTLFDRFDSPRAHAQKSAEPNPVLKNGAPAAESHARSSAVTHLTPLPALARQSSFGRIFSAELRLALQGIRWWGYAVAAGLLIAQFVAPLDAARGPILGTAWMWCVFLWSASGSRESRHGMRQILFSCAKILPRQFLACWLAGVSVALLAGAGALSRVLLTNQPPAALAIISSALLIPSLALALGIITGSGKFFEALLTILWYVGPMNHTIGLDYTGAANAQQTFRYALIYLALAAVFLCAAFLTRSRQLRGD
jgi:hypothetical protein